jgi:hypothetical protein
MRSEIDLSADGISTGTASALSNFSRGRRHLSRDRSFRPGGVGPTPFGSDTRASFACVTGGGTSGGFTSRKSFISRNREESKCDNEYEQIFPYQAFLDKLMEASSFDLVEKIR